MRLLFGVPLNSTNVHASSFSSIDSLAASNADNEIRLGLQAHFRETIDLLSRGFATKEDVRDFEIGFLQCFYELLAG